MRITCDRCGKDRMVNETQAPQRDLRIGRSPLQQTAASSRIGGRLAPCFMTAAAAGQDGWSC
jgi:hypothetical protein